MIPPEAQADGPVDPSTSLGIDRRGFLAQIPRRVLAGAREVMSQVSWRRDASPEPEAARGGRLAMIDVSRCMAWAGGTCQVCYLRCPRRDEAMLVDDGRPLIVAAGCDGCGVCVETCQAVNDLGAIRLVFEPVSTEEGARRPRA